MWTQPTSGTAAHAHACCPNTRSPAARSATPPASKSSSRRRKPSRAMSWEQLAYVQIDWVGIFTAAAGCVIYDGGAWPAEYNGDYFTTEPTINIIHHERLTPEGISYTGDEAAGPRGDGIHPQQGHVVAPDRSPRRPRRRGLYRRLLQPGRHPQRHARPRSQPASTPPSAPTATTTSAASGGSTTSRRRSSRCRICRKADVQELVEGAGASEPSRADDGESACWSRNGRRTEVAATC